MRKANVNGGVLVNNFLFGVGGDRVYVSRVHLDGNVGNYVQSRCVINIDFINE